MRLRNNSRVPNLENFRWIDNKLIADLPEVEGVGAGGGGVAWVRLSWVSYALSIGINPVTQPDLPTQNTNYTNSENKIFRRLPTRITRIMEAGPEIPPHILAKRKRKAEEAAAAAAAAAIGPTNSEQSEGDKTTAEKRPRVIGPAPPPASLDERPNNIPTGEEEEESSDDDEIGPALPSGLAPEVSSHTMVRRLGLRLTHQ